MLKTLKVLCISIIMSVSAKANNDIVDPPIVRRAVAIGNIINTESNGVSLGSFGFSRIERGSLGSLLKEDVRGFMKPEVKVLAKGWGNINCAPYVVAKALMEPEVIGWTTPRYVVVFSLIVSYSNSGKLFSEEGIAQAVLRKFGVKIAKEQIYSRSRSDDAIVVLGSPTVIDTATGEDVDYGFIWQPITVRYKRAYEKDFRLQSANIFSRLFSNTGIRSSIKEDNRPLYVTASTLHKAAMQAGPQIRRIAQAIASIPEENED